jgi:PHD/YefM family antitoxin component YafN of YafNO toxin-antitoxin module
MAEESESSIVLSCVHNFRGGFSMRPVKVGIREFREKLTTYLLESSKPVAITRHGDTVGYYIPARQSRPDADIEALRQAAARLDKMLAAHGIDEDEIVREFQRRRREKK